ncbi:hypothetical protein RCO28_19810 [Streptomyces sp. LHD-70]|uniref:RipA family octameric membrane protein n=1 Tax=Streptomyces sp. LHD-70 TaxID=3072140 RepID=UPI00280C8247|nr:hypothetical protein [Streptomyces sp. LHD-70]MDQ8704721.1 hypothetical protein [Streptomyces sp. LHD-70]
MTDTQDSNAAAVDVRTRLWNEEVGAAQYTAATERYQSALFEQYKLCVEMADRVSARRSLANTFFLTVNSVLMTVLATTLPAQHSAVSTWLLAPGLLVLLCMCASWFALVRSYRQLNTAKWAVIGAFEERLPAYAYSRAEWTVLGEGRDWRTYLQLSSVEQWVPVLFAVSYVVGFIALLP